MPDLSTSSAAVQSAEVKSELQDYLHVRQARRTLFPRALLVGILSGAVAVAFRIALSAGEAARGRLIGWSHGFGLPGIVWPVLWGAVGAGLAVWMTRRYAPEAAGSGIPHLEAVLHRLREMNWRRLVPVKFAAGVLALGSGLALGREGPTVQLGGGVGAAVSDLLKVPQQDRQTLIAAGAGAGLAAAFNAPLSGLVFVLEEVQRDFRPMVFGAAFLASAAASVLARAVSGQFPVFEVPAYPVQDLTLLPAFALVGVATGAIGAAFNRGLLWTMDRYESVAPSRRTLAAALTGAVIGAVAFAAPGAVGGGHDLAEEILTGRMLLTAIPLWLALRFILTLGSYGTGAPGGVFAPLLVLGALGGLAVGIVTGRLFPGSVPDPGAFAVVGMGACFAAIVQAPLTGIVLILEMTGNYAQMLPLLVACFVAYIVAEWLGASPLYEALLQRDLARRGVSLHAAEPVVVEVEVREGAPFAFRRVRDLGLPPGTVLVRCREGEREWIPTAETVLTPHVRITAVIAPDSDGGLAALHDGCGEEVG